MTRRLISTFLASPELVYSAAKIQETGCPISVISSRSSNRLELRSQTFSYHPQDQGYHLCIEIAIVFNIIIIYNEPERIEVYLLSWCDGDSKFSSNNNSQFDEQVHCYPSVDHHYQAGKVKLPEWNILSSLDCTVIVIFTVPVLISPVGSGSRCTMRYVPVRGDIWTLGSFCT